MEFYIFWMNQVCENLASFDKLEIVLVRIENEPLLSLGESELSELGSSQIKEIESLKRLKDNLTELLKSKY